MPIPSIDPPADIIIVGTIGLLALVLLIWILFRNNLSNFTIVLGRIFRIQVETHKPGVRINTGPVRAQRSGELQTKSVAKSGSRSGWQTSWTSSQPPHTSVEPTLPPVNFARRDDFENLASASLTSAESETSEFMSDEYIVQFAKSLMKGAEDGDAIQFRDQAKK